MQLRPGIRVVLRYRDGDSATDALGTVEDVTDDTVTVRTKRGPTVVQREAILLAHEVPPAPVRTGMPHEVVSAVDLRRISAAAWLPPESTWLHSDNVRAEAAGATDFVQTGWLLRSEPAAPSKRANSTVPLDDPGMPTAQALDAVENWYTSRDARPMVQIYSADASSALAPGCVELGPLLRERDYEALPPTLLLTGATREAAAGATRAADAALPGLTIEVADSPSEDYLAALGYPTDHEGHEAYRRLLTSGEQVQFLTAWANHPDGSRSPVAACRLVEVSRWAVVTNLVTQPALRRRGAGRAIVRAALATAASRGVRSFLADVEADNAASIALFESLGAAVAQRSWYARR